VKIVHPAKMAKIAHHVVNLVMAKIVHHAATLKIVHRAATLVMVKIVHRVVISMMVKIVHRVVILMMAKIDHRVVILATNLHAKIVRHAKMVKSVHVVISAIDQSAQDHQAAIADRAASQVLQRSMTWKISQL
jgi:hypothetical protein